MGSKPGKGAKPQRERDQKAAATGSTDRGDSGRPHAATLPTNANTVSPPATQPSTQGSSSAANSSSSDLNRSKPKSNTISLVTGAAKGAKDESSGFSMKKLEEVYTKFMDADDNEQIGPDGMTRFFKALEVDPEDVVTLVLAWHLEAAVMGFFSKTEFMRFQKLNLDTLPKIKAALKTFREELDDPVKLKEIYKYAFGFAKEKNQRYLEIPTAQAMMSLILGDKSAHVSSFLKFLNEQSSYKALNIDQWMSFLEFSRTITEDLSNYDETSAWPVMLDEYVEWLREQRGGGDANEERNGD